MDRLRAEVERLTSMNVSLAMPHFDVLFAGNNNYLK
jgi:hypothetical protein